MNESISALEQGNQANIANTNVEGALDSIINEKTRPRFRRLRSAAAALAILTSVGSILHEQIILGGELAASDIEQQFTGPPDPQLVSAPQDEALVETYNIVQEHAVGNGLYKNGFVYAKFWPTTRIIDALYIMSLLPSNQSAGYSSEYLLSFDASQDYWQTGSPKEDGYDPAVSAFNFGGTRQIDDSLWMGLIAMRQYNTSSDLEQLKRSRQIFALSTANWDQNGGGIDEKEKSSGKDATRCVVSNAPAIELGVELYQATGNKHYLDWSIKIYNWLHHTLLDKDTGLYDDHVNGSHVYTPKRTYVQGVMIGALDALNEVEPDRFPLSRAVDLTTRSIKYFMDHHTYGDPAFDQIYFENVLYLSARYNNPQFTNEVRLALSQAIDAIPKNLAYSSLTIEAGALGLRALGELPPNEYLDLFPLKGYKLPFPADNI